MTEESKTFATDAIWDVIGRKSNKFHRQNIQLEIKQDKSELKHLVATEYRLFVLKTKPLKLEQSIHYGDITEVHSNNIQKLSMSMEGRQLRMTSCGDETFRGLMSFIFERFSTINHDLPLNKRCPHLSVADDIMPTISDALQIPQNNPHLLTPCGNFTMVYHSKCDQMAAEYHEDVAWDIDAIYNSQNCYELNLSDFDHLSPKNMVPMLSALEYNKWFTKLNLSNIRMTSDIQNELLKILKENDMIEDLNLSNTGIKSEFVSRFASMKCASLKSLDLSSNNLDDKALQNLTTFVSAPNKTLTSLNLSRNSMTSAGVNNLARVLANGQAKCSLTCLDLSENVLKDEVVALQNFLAIPNNIKVLKLADTETPLENFFAASLRGCTQHLEVLDLSGCQLHSTSKKNSSIPISWKHFFASVSKLRSIDFSNNKFTPDCYKLIFEGLEENTVADDIEINFSGCQIGSSPPAVQIFEQNVGRMTKISSLDLSDNAFDQSLANILSKLANNKTLKKLSIGRNLANVKTKFFHQVVESLVALIQEEGSKLEVLCLDGLKLKSDSMDFINSLGLNASLTQLDVTGNMLGDAVAKMLAKALQINRKLISLTLDNNQFTCTGFEHIANSLEKNTTLKVLPVPVIDLVASMKLNADRTEKALRKMESCIVRNNSSKMPLNMEPAYKLQQWISNAEQETFNKNILELSQTIDAIRASNMKLEDSLKEKLTTCEKIRQEAKDVKNVLSDLHKLSLETFDSLNSDISKIFHEKAKNFSDSMTRFMNKNYENSLKAFSQECKYNPNLTAKEEAELDRKVRGSIPALSSCLLGPVAYEKSTNLSEFLISSVALSVEFALVNARSIQCKHFKDGQILDEGMKPRDDEKMEEKRNGSRKNRIRPTSSSVSPAPTSQSDASRLSIGLLLDNTEVIAPIPKPRNKKKRMEDVPQQGGDDDDDDGVGEQNDLDVKVPPTNFGIKLAEFHPLEGGRKNLLASLKSSSEDGLDGRKEMKEKRDALEDVVPCQDVDQSDGAKMSRHDSKDDVTTPHQTPTEDSPKSPSSSSPSVELSQLEGPTQKLTHLCKSRPKRPKNKVGSRTIVSFEEMKDGNEEEVESIVTSSVTRHPSRGTTDGLKNILSKKHQSLDLPSNSQPSSPPSSDQIIKSTIDPQNDSPKQPPTATKDSITSTQPVEPRKRTATEGSCIEESNIANRSSCDQQLATPSVVKRVLPPGAKPGFGGFAMLSVNELQQKRLSMKPIHVDSLLTEKPEEKRNSTGTILDSSSDGKIKPPPPLAPKPIKSFRDSRRESDTNPIIIIDDKHSANQSDNKSKDEEPSKPASFMEEFRKKQEKNRNS